MSDRVWKLFRVHLQDEIPGIGQGERLVEAQVGRKWAYVRRHPVRMNRKHRVRLATWQALNPEEITS